MIWLQQTVDVDVKQQTTTDVEISSGFCFSFPVVVVGDITITGADVILAMTTASGSSYFSSAAAAGATAVVSANLLSIFFVGRGFPPSIPVCFLSFPFCSPVPSEQTCDSSAPECLPVPDRHCHFSHERRIHQSHTHCFHLSPNVLPYVLSPFFSHRAHHHNILPDPNKFSLFICHFLISPRIYCTSKRRTANEPTRFKIDRL